MSENRNSMPQDWVDEDDAPELDEAWFEKATLKIGGQAIPNGQIPNLVLLDPDLAEHFRSRGGDWTN